ncbi:DUF1697 domain-containing protein [Alloyangia pacifica]|uniref:Uncharacterized conserved protein, DUF1697 family n=1 Tax=Alloyangia pacifica TaxID=311180 RepID=A0A1I6NVQ2_9RHOB|nr:DUF1697 domain-containing protein [Alloyangia pacifica]SDH59566.1 Uncharacterized conserved protein, DUF1697 family [Alloyangia pacifica]SFS31965.1 Uncharacterized conserved protein, DUF1697 family [Alloyangia pacifica]
MTLHVALLRGLNVGGAKALPMLELRTLCEGLGWRDVQTHLASGNLIFEAEGTPAALAEALQEALAARGLAVPVLVLPPDEIRRALAGCPFDPAASKLVHAAFLFRPAKLDREVFDRFAAPGDEIDEQGGILWLHTPGGFGRSKLATRLEAIAGAPLTVRNLSSLGKLVHLLDAREQTR